MSDTTRKLYKNSPLANVVLAVVFAISFAYLLARSYTGTSATWSSAIFLVAALTLAALALVLLVKHLSFSVSQEDSVLSIRMLGRERKLLLDDIVSVDVRRMNLVLESVYVRDKEGRRFSFERSLSNYTELKEVLLDALERNLVRREAAVLGRHVYSTKYKGTLISLLLGVWGLFFALFPHRVLFGEFAESDLDTVAVCIVILSLAIPGSIVAAGDFHFVLLVERDRIRASRFGRESAIDLSNVTEVRVSKLMPIESTSITGTSSNSIVFHRFLLDYEAVKRFVLRRCA